MLQQVVTPGHRPGPHGEGLRTSGELSSGCLWLKVIASLMLPLLKLLQDRQEDHVREAEAVNFGDLWTDTSYSF
jgi:hypothetical protein